MEQIWHQVRCKSRVDQIVPSRVLLKCKSTHYFLFLFIYHDFFSGEDNVMTFSKDKHTGAVSDNDDVDGSIDVHRRLLLEKIMVTLKL